MTRRALPPIAAAIAAIAIGIAVLVARSGHAPNPPTGMDAETVPALPRDLDTLDPRVAALVRERYTSAVAAPEATAAWMSYGLALHANELYDDAAEVYRRVVAADAAVARAWYLLGRVETHLGRVDEALAALGEAAKRDGQYAPAFWRQGMLRLERGEPERAVPLFERAVALDSTGAAGTLGLSRALLAIGRHPEAIRSLESWLENGLEKGLEKGLDESGTNTAYAGHLLSIAYRRAGRIDDAARMAARSGDTTPRWQDPWESALAEHRPGYGARIRHARALISAGRMDEAITALEMLRADHPDNVTVLSNLGLAYRRRGRLHDSVAALESAIALDESFFLAHFHLAVACAEASGLPEPPAPVPTLRARAHRHLDRALDLNPNYAPAHSLRGDLARLDGRPADAVAHFREAARCDPIDARWPFRLGVALLEVGRWPEASIALVRAAELQPDDAEIRRGVAVAAMNLGRLDEAERALDAAETIAPGSARIGATRDQLAALRAARGERRP